MRGVTLSIDEGEIVTLIGANGAGKSTTLRTISGLSGRVRATITLRGKQIDGMRPHEIVGLGICQSPEGRRVFARMTVHENLEMGAFSRTDTASLPNDYERVYTLFPRLRERDRSARRHPVRRRAADAGHRPGPDGCPEGPPAR